MYVKMEDGKAILASYILRVDLTKEQQEELLVRFQVEKDKIVCYSVEEKLLIEEALNSLQISFTVEEITFTEEQKNKVQGLKYQSRSEIIAHLQGEIEDPESEIVPRLKREKVKLEQDLIEHKQKLSQTESALLAVMFNKKGG